MKMLAGPAQALEGHTLPVVTLGDNGQRGCCWNIHRLIVCLHIIFNVMCIAVLKIGKSGRLYIRVVGWSVRRPSRSRQF